MSRIFTSRLQEFVAAAEPAREVGTRGVRALAHERLCRGARGIEQIEVRAEIGEAQQRRATLARPEELARPAQPQVVAKLTQSGAEALPTPRDAILPTALEAGATLVCLTVEAPQGEYRAGDQLWLRQLPTKEAPKMINRDVLVPRSGGRFAFGRLIDRQGTLVGLLPPGTGQRQVVVDNPAWLAVAEMLVRKL